MKKNTDILIDLNKFAKRVLELQAAAQKKKRQPKLNKPFRTPGGPKKFAVYVKNDKGNIVLVRFGDPNMEIRRDNPDRRKSFRARHNCANPGPKWKARYWACKTWTSTPVSKIVGSELIVTHEFSEKIYPLQEEIYPDGLPFFDLEEIENCEECEEKEE